MDKWLLLQVLKYADMEYSSDNTVRQNYRQINNSLPFKCHSYYARLAWARFKW